MRPHKDRNLTCTADGRTCFIITFSTETNCESMVSACSHTVSLSCSHSATVSQLYNSFETMYALLHFKFGSRADFRQHNTIRSQTKKHYVIQLALTVRLVHFRFSQSSFPNFRFDSMCVYAKGSGVKSQTGTRRSVGTVPMEVNLNWCAGRERAVPDSCHTG